MLLRYDDAFHYQNIFGPLVKLEAETDQCTKEAQTVEGVSVRWDMGLNKRRLAFFQYPKAEAEARLAIGDELRMRHGTADAAKPAWEGTGTIIRFSNNEEVVLELKSNAGVPTDATTGFCVDIVWRPITYDRMQMAMRTFAVDETSLSVRAGAAARGRAAARAPSRPPGLRVARSSLPAERVAEGEGSCSVDICSHRTVTLLTLALTLLQTPCLPSPGTGLSLSPAARARPRRADDAQGAAQEARRARPQPAQPLAAVRRDAGAFAAPLANPRATRHGQDAHLGDHCLPHGERRGLRAVAGARGARPAHAPSRLSAGLPSRHAPGLPSRARLRACARCAVRCWPVAPRLHPIRAASLPALAIRSRCTEARRSSARRPTSPSTT